MKLIEVQRLLNAEILTGKEFLEKLEIKMICGSDLISDVLSFTKEKTLLLTGLTNPQVVKTAEMIDLSGIIFVRGKMPSDDVIAMARKKKFPLLVTKLPLYESCGILYSAGIKGCSDVDFNRRG